ncbi:MAG: lipoprotein insertase outer membrane protein LolB [Dokdonella sp.]
MMRSLALRCGGCTLALLLAACAGPQVKPVAANADLLTRQAEREQVVSARAEWRLSGRLGVSDGRDSGSGSLEWTQRSDEFRFSVHAPVTGKTWTLSGTPRRAVLEGLREQPLEGDAADLLARELGWQVPVAELTRWVRGLRTSPQSRITFTADGLPATIDEAGWHVQYQGYDTAFDPPLPSKVFASKGDYKVRLAIREWTLR